MLTKIWMPAIVVWLLNLFTSVDTYSCWDYNAYMNCNGHTSYGPGDDTEACWEDYNGNFQSCWTQFSRGSSSNQRFYNYGWSSDWYGGGYHQLWIGRRCHDYCETCNGGSQPDWSCLTCRSGYYRWTGVQRCWAYCPNEISLPTNTGYIGQRGQFQSSSNWCAACNSQCAWCYGSASTCYTCISSYYLIDDQSLCTTNYPAPRDHTCHSNLQCVSSCPEYYYFPVAQGNTGSYTWTNIRTDYSQRGFTGGSGVLYRRNSNVCHPCNAHCDKCDQMSQTNCLICSKGNYMWRQRNKYCESYCPYGTYGQSWIGQFIHQNTSIYINATDSRKYRYCQYCDSQCLVCQSTSDNCFICKDADALMDLFSECQAQYTNDATCIECQSYSCEKNHYCRPGGCPAYFFFELKRSLTLSAIDQDAYQQQETDYANANSTDYTKMLYPDHVRYATIINAASFVTKYGVTENYRKFTDFCMLCDPFCIKCDGPLNINCQKCRNFKYKWVAPDTVCDQYCKQGQYIALDMGYPANETQCRTCMSRCEICNMLDDNCTVCVGRNYNYANANAGFLYINDSSYSTCLQVCPTSAEPTVDIGHYGSIAKMVCLPCPYPCLQCNIQLLRTYYASIGMQCSDDYCSNGIVCTDCLPGFSKVAGKCIEQDNCKQYAYYQQGDTSTTFSTDNCKCLQGYSSTVAAKCDKLCYINCRTCTGNASNQCSTCEKGYTLSGTSCVDNNYGSDIWIKGGLSEGTNTFSPSIFNGNCGGVLTVFGYRSFSSAKYYQHDLTVNSSRYYAIQAKLTMLFVDQFDSQGAIYISVGTQASSPVWSWNFDTKEAYGEQRCGDNRMDYVLNLYAEIPKNWTSNPVSIFIQSNQDLIESNSALQLHWGISKAMFTALPCHSSCSSCTGPDQTDCTACVLGTQTVVDGDCVCNSGTNGAGYYMWDDGTCHQFCDTSDPSKVYYADSLKRKCILLANQDCQPPYRFAYKPTASAYGYCVIDCPSSFYASMNTMTCLSNCSTQSQYSYTGASRTCEDACPNGYIANPNTSACVSICPSTWFLKLQNRDTNPICGQNCTTGYSYDTLQECVEHCPSGYFKQVISTYPKCVPVCLNGWFGNPETGECTASCPFPKYGDGNNKLCVDTCSDAAQFMQVRVADLFRSCVDQCQSGQYGNPFTKKCSNYTTDCPDGYFADTHSRLCQANCTVGGQVAENSTKKCQTFCTTGYAHWESRRCVAICPQNPELYGVTVSATNKYCTNKCDFATTGVNNLFADPQASRKCVTKCSATPVATFGEVDTSTCVTKCTITNQYGDSLDSTRRCVTTCTAGTFSYIETKLCVSKCPDSYYADSTTIAGKGQCAKNCVNPYFADPVENICRLYCRWGYYALPDGIRPCVQTCPYDWFGINMTNTNRKCVRQCDDGYWGDLQTSMCYNVKTDCTNNTYADKAKRLCVIATNCTEGTFADPFTKGCEATCSNGYYADDNINTCVDMCSDTPDEFGLWGICRSSCQFALRVADWQANRTCQRTCSTSPLVLYGDLSNYYCVQAKNCPTDFYGTNATQTCVKPCATPFPFGDPISKQCVVDCPDGTYGDPTKHTCVQVCDFSTNPPYYADNQTGNCETLCTLGTFGVNSSTVDHVPSCEYDCPPGSFARDTDRICVSDCQSGLYGDPIDRVCHSDPMNCPDGYFANSVSHLCVLPQNCQTDADGHFFGQNSTKTCVKKCNSPNFGDSKIWVCIAECNTTFFGQTTTRLCLSGCAAYGTFADNQTRQCVSRCSDTPFQHYADTVNHICVEPLKCPTSLYVTFAQNSSQTCVQYCNATNSEWADTTTKRCVTTCPNAYYKDDSTGHNLCSSTCPGTYRFRDNSTGSCVDICPIGNATFGDSNADRCVYTCPLSYFAQVDTNRRCVDTCKATTWGNKITRVCITDPLNECPPSTWADDFTHLCTDVCSSSQNYYGNNITKKCGTSCPSPSFAYDGTRVCIDICPASLVNSGLFGDPTTNPRKCYSTCQTSGYYRDPEASRTCATGCTFNNTYKSYKDSTTGSCEKVCSTFPSVRYADDNLKSCQLTCAGSLKKYDANQTCISTCPALYDPTTDSCVQKCPRYSTSGVLYANLNTHQCVVASSCPTSTYADYDNNLCTGTCPKGTYIYGGYCVYNCPDNYYRDQSTQSCVIPTNCPTGQFADNSTRSCVKSCVGSFGDSVLRRCIFRCYGSKYGDPFKHTCQSSCSGGLSINTANNSCVASCQIGLFKNPDNGSCSSTCNSPYYADNNTQACVSVCTANPMTFAAIVSSKRVCVEHCQSNQMHDLINKKCVSTCPNNTFAYNVNMSCVAFCPEPSHYQLGTQCVTNCSSANKYADDVSRTCTSTCPAGTYKDPLTYKCVVECPSSPVQYYISESQEKCTTSCPANTYASNQDFKCVSDCPLSPRMFGLQSTTNVCVASCPLSTNTFADLQKGKCVSTCDSGFADPRDRTCKTNCSFLFADSSVNPPACVEECTSGYANELTYTCDGSCPSNYFAHTPTKKCVKFCPDGYFADTDSDECVPQILCPALYPYADSLTHKCTDQCSNNQWGYLAAGTTTGGQCLFYCPPNYYSNPLSGLCEQSCPQEYFSDDTNQTCTQTCPDGTFMDEVNNQCTVECPLADALFADLFQRKCVTQCRNQTFSFADTETRTCERTCSGDQYADQQTLTCVGQASCTNTDQFTDPFYKKCVDVCYNGTFGYQGHCLTECPTNTDSVYADIQLSICVTADQCPAGTYGNPFTKTCVQFCSIETSTFADVDNKICVTGCEPLYADNSTRSCVQVCPNVPTLFGDNDTYTCVHKCPYLSFADETINLCVTHCPDGYFADQSTLTCVKKCPQGKFGNNVTNYCVNTCPLTGKYFGNPRTRECVLYCPDGTYADVDHNRQCQPKCFKNALTYAENSTKECKTNCLTGFKNERTKQCISVCTSGYYGYAKVCYKNCPSASPLVFADDSTNLCQQDCPQGTYGDKFSLKCVQVCPISKGTFADDSTGRCQSICQQTGTYADPSTRKCVGKCPQIPALFGNNKVCISKCLGGLYADNKTRTCKNSCPDGTYADNITMRCQLVCPTQPLMFGENITNKCVEDCDATRNMFADNATRTCVFYCSHDSFTFADPVSRTCVDTCPQDYFARNLTQVCEKTCSPDSFADPLLRICVAECSADPIYYGDRDSWKCVQECPSNSFGNPLNQQCEKSTAAGISTCPENHYADQTTKLCVQVCPMKHDIYGDPITKYCQFPCSDGYVADNSTMKCVQKCPQYPNFFQNQLNHRCVFNCPNDTFADENSRKCVDTCPNSTYAQNLTQRCVQKCQYQPLGFADDSSWTCVEFCPSGTFSDNSTLKCVDKCPEEQNTFGEIINNTCVKRCPDNYYADVNSRECESGCTGIYFADNSTNRCVQQCPKYPPYYAQPIDNTCVFTCPPGYFAYEENRTCLEQCPPNFYRQNSTSSCVQRCDFSELTFADSLTKYCVTRCSEDSWADPTTHVCVQKCPNQPLMYADNSTQSCVIKCPSPTYGENQTRSCVNVCPPGSLSFLDQNLCVRYCPNGYFAYQTTSFCESVCPSPLYGDPSVRKCVDKCPLSQLLFADNSTRRCVATCPSGSYADKQSVQCLQECPDNPSTGKQTFAADYNNSCVQQCSLPYYGYLPTKKCVTNCPDPYYNDVRDHMCYLCPQTCKTCSTYNLCTVCIPNFYLQSGECVQTCSQKYFANNVTMKCVSSPACSPYFGVNETHTCNTSCPDGSYKNYNLFRCDACPSTCITCTSWTVCQTCIAESEKGYNYCYPYCNTTHVYYDSKNATCLQSCPAGTYLDVLFCKTCDAKCTTCSNVATNCTLCANGLYLQNQICVSTCSSTSRPNSTRHCVYCGSECDAPLDFSTNITSIDGENTVFITFNKQVTTNDDLSNIFSLSQKRRRLLAENVHVSRRLLVDYRIQRVDGETFKIVILDDTNIEDFQVQILQPESITDQSGNIPVKTRDEVKIDINNTYQTNTSNQQITDFSTFFQIMAIVSIISFLFDLEFLKYLQLLFIHYFVAMVLPPQLSKALAALRYSTLSYLPTLYPIPEAVLKQTVPGKIYDICGDFSFLRNGGFVLTPLLALFLLTLIMKILTVPQINRFKSVRIWCKDQFEQKFKIAFFIEFISIFYLNTIFFIFLQMRDYQNYDAFSMASIVISDILLVVLLIVIAVISKKVISFFLEHKKLSTNLKKATDIILQQKEYHKLNTSNIFLFQMKKIDLRNIFYPKINNQNIFPFRVNYRFNFLALMCLSVTYLRGLIISLIIAIAHENTMLQMSLCLPVNVLCMLYFIKSRPYSFKFHKKRFRNYIAIFNEATLVGFELLILALGILQRDEATSAEKEQVGLGILIFLTVTISINFIYFIFRIGVQIWRRMFLPFSQTQLFKDNFPNAYEKLHGSPDKKKKLLKGIDPRAKEAIRAMVKSYKYKKSGLRPNEQDKANPQLPIKYQLKYFNQDASSIGTKSSMTKSQKKKMLKEIFASQNSMLAEQKQMMDKDFEEVLSERQSEEETEFEEVEEEIEIKAKDLEKYVKNADELLRLKRHQGDEDF